ncbi:MAG: phosphomannomutase/phosphoglucomutase [Deltaproteobacteria bacterium]|nr:MAG: phosphomannomutase/phosphoglucomutase [Deltaproteobacteria bacterium]
MNEHVFRAYDIRGVADVDLTDPFVFALGQAFATLVARRSGGHRVAVGRDCRLSSDRIFRAFASGLRASGADVVDLGVVSSPILYWAVHHFGTDGGVQITGSHNPAAHNGFKMMLGTATLHGDAIAELKRLVARGDFLAGDGGVIELDPLGAYVDDIAGRVRLARPLKVVVDGGNGTGGPPAVALLERLGVEVVPLYVDMDGRFPNHHPDPTVEENLAELRAAVLAEGADLGVAYDGDADRIGVIDDLGHVLWGDRLMILLSRDVLARHPGAAIVGEVKCSKTLFEDIEAQGGRPIMSQVGHSLIKARMKVEEALLAGEMSGHIFYADRWYGFDDAVYVTARLLEILAREDMPLSALLSDVPVTHVTPEIRMDCPDDEKFDVVARAAAHFGEHHPVVDIDGVRVDFGDGWGLIRASNTQPVLVLRAEADDAAALARIRTTLEEFVRDAS